MAKDPDEEIDTAELEQEDWIDYMKRSTAEADGQNEYSQDPMLDRNALKTEVATGDENIIATKRTMG